MTDITYPNKVTGNTTPFTAANANEIKTAVNSKADQADLDTTNAAVALNTAKVTYPGPQDISGKQDTLVSGTNIKTINGEAVTGSGNLVVSGTGGDANVNADWDATTGDAEILNKPSIPSSLSDLSEDATHRTVTDAEKTTWNSATGGGLDKAGIEALESLDLSGVALTLDDDVALDTDITFENLNANGDVGTGAAQIAAGNHNHAGVYLTPTGDGSGLTGISGSFLATERITAPSAGDMGSNTFAIDTVTGIVYVQAANGMWTGPAGTWTPNPVTGDTILAEQSTAYDYASTVTLYGTDRIVGTSFQVSGGGTANSVSLWVKQNDTETSTLTVAIGTTADVATSSIGSGTLTLNGDGTAGEVEVTLDSGVVLADATTYYLAVYSTDADFGSKVTIYGTNTNPYADGVMHSTSSGWPMVTMTASYDLYFKVSGTL